jgi:hypothetical protein
MSHIDLELKSPKAMNWSSFIQSTLMMVLAFYIASADGHNDGGHESTARAHPNTQFQRA